MNKYYDCIVIGGGHAAIEAALAPSRMGYKTLMVNLFFDTIGQMSCNPAIGGVGKGQLVKEIDVLGGSMGMAADIASIQFRQLNASKGEAVRSSRCQADRKIYKKYMQNSIKNQENLDFLEDEVTEILAKNKHVTGINTNKSGRIESKTVILAAGTFLDGRLHVGPKITPGGRINEPSSIKLTKSLKDIGFEILMFKTGTPPRLDGKTIDFTRLEIQHSDASPVPFSFRTKMIPPEQELLPCYITYTNENTHSIIKSNMHLSPMYSGQINATGVRYCPSIEDKLKKFSDKERHHVFLEPEGLDTDLYYPNGISTGLPEKVQEEFVHTIPGLENVKITQYGYSIEHGIIHPTVLKPSLETKSVKGLFFAGQVNGSTGYEEAAAQGIMAGINAALYIKNKEPFILKRNESYIGVLIDDLVTKGTEEPYRMFTSRVEYRLLIREDNADKRLGEYAFNLGLISGEFYTNIKNKYDAMEKEIEYLKNAKISPSRTLNEELGKINCSILKKSVFLSDLLKRPQVNFEFIANFDNKLKSFDKSRVDQIEYEIKYQGFINRQLKEVEKFRHIENIRIPKDINYDEINSLSIEIKQKLKFFNPGNLGQASRISGVTPAAISILMVYLKKISREKKENKN